MTNSVCCTNKLVSLGGVIPTREGNGTAASRLTNSPQFGLAVENGQSEKANPNRQVISNRCRIWLGDLLRMVVTPSCGGHRARPEYCEGLFAKDFLRRPFCEGLFRSCHESPRHVHTPMVHGHFFVMLARNQQNQHPRMKLTPFQINAIHSSVLPADLPDTPAVRPLCNEQGTVAETE